MKQIKVKDDYKSFEAKLSGSVSYSLNHSFLPVQENHASEIITRWGALLDVKDMGIEETIDEIRETEVNEEETTEEVKLKRPKSKKHE